MLATIIRMYPALIQKGSQNLPYPDPVFYFIDPNYPVEQIRIFCIRINEYVSSYPYPNISGLNLRRKWNLTLSGSDLLYYHSVSGINQCCRIVIKSGILNHKSEKLWCPVYPDFFNPVYVAKFRLWLILIDLIFKLAKPVFKRNPDFFQIWVYFYESTVTVSGYLLLLTAPVFGVSVH